ncbi:MAG: DUF2225 domain-containing protein [Lachnospiraceae bacterium]|nr:DUF2225 domain-containing protein [Lachnospiraceae bacterium]
MRGQLPGGNLNNTSMDAFDEASLLLPKDYVCPVCNKEFTSMRVLSGKAMSDGMDYDLRPLYKNIDPLKYRALECPVCGYADIDIVFNKIHKREIAELKKKMDYKDLEDYTPESVRDYRMAYSHFKAVIRCNLIRGAKSSKRAHAALWTAWLLRNWRDSLEKNGETVAPDDTMGINEENKLLKYTLRNFKDAEFKESFPMSNIDEPTLYYIMAAIYYSQNDYRNSQQYVLQVLQNRSVSGILRTKAEDLKEDIREQIRAGKA